MSYTSEDLVQRHLATAVPVVAMITDQPLVAGTGGSVQFFSGAVDASSVVVKSPAGGALIRTALTLQTGANIVAATPLVPGSVVVAGDSSLGSVYTENHDYVVDYHGGQLYVKAGGALSAGRSVVIWYRPYTVYTVGIDYAVTADSGELRRLSGGNIDPNETVFLDYAPVYASVNEAVVQAAVLEANNLIKREIDPAEMFGADPVLQASATNAALAILCRSSAARALLITPGDDRAAVAWMKLSEQYGTVSERLLKAFRPPLESPAPPRLR